jgi:hypothetical protein
MHPTMAGTMNGPRVLLAGGTGLVGRRLARALAERGISVVVLSRSGGNSALPPGVAVQSWDALPTPMEDVSAVVNLAGAGLGDRRWTPERKRLLWQSRIATTARLVAAMAASPIRPAAFLSASAIGYYGNRSAGICEEGSAPGEGFLPELCAAWEAEADRAVDLGVRVVKLRIGVVLAREGGALPRMALPVRLCAGAAFGDGRQVLSWIHIADLVDLALAALRDPGYAGPVNATAPGAVGQADFMRALGRRLHRPILPFPGGLTAAAARLLAGEMAGPLLLEGADVQPAKALALGFQFRFPTLDSALEDLYP